jgi:nicotinate-nucleotide adenylyltransferase
MRIGIFGGTFDPPHLGHLEVALAAQRQLNLDEVVWIPAAKNPFKQSAIVTPGPKRLRMVQAAVADTPGMSVSDIELTRGGLSYTIDTVLELQMMQEGEYWIIVGSDSLEGISNWKQVEKLAKLARFACILRPPHTEEIALRHVADYIPPVTDFVSMPPSRLSSTLVRDHAMRGLDIIDFVHPEVAKLIEEYGRYGR